jgi:predicted DsbA family dithiol-disulfide isomerase
MSLVEVWSDPVCPWCFIGKRRLAKAVEGLDVRVAWRPFQLNPQMPREGMPRAQYRAAKFGSLERSRELEARVAEVGREEGIAFAFDRIARTPNTFDAHRLLRRALRAGAQDAVAEALFRAYFLDGRDLGDPAVLAELGGGPLAGDEEAEDVRREEAEGRTLGIQGVPFFVIDRRVGLSGAQPADVLRSAILDARGPGRV